jgi:hypothetical protein
MARHNSSPVGTPSAIDIMEISVAVKMRADDQCQPAAEAARVASGHGVAHPLARVLVLPGWHGRRLLPCVA